MQVYQYGFPWITETPTSQKFISFGSIWYYVYSSQRTYEDHFLKDDEKTDSLKVFQRELVSDRNAEVILYQYNFEDKNDKVRKQIKYTIEDQEGTIYVFEDYESEQDQVPWTVTLYSERDYGWYSVYLSSMTERPSVELLKSLKMKPID